jgi:Ser/Thr protein kinase RdoA (MazF antagonist)
MPMQRHSEERADNIIAHFPVSGSLIKAEKFGSGLINDTYLCSFRNGNDDRKYILQRINTTVFRRPEEVMMNVEVVTRHIADRLRGRGVTEPFAVTPALIHTREGASHYRDASGGFWRVFHFIESGEVFDSIIDVKHAYEVGRGLGSFQSLVSDLAPDKLRDTLPGFHHTPLYLNEYDCALRADAAGRRGDIAAEAAFVEERRSLAPLLTDALTTGGLPVRVVHNDPKVNNIMLDKAAGKALCMLDLDTVKPGTALFDFGDCLRSAANPLGEDAADPRSVEIDLPLFEAAAAGYLREAGAFLTEKEKEMLPLSVMVITFELGIRFLADYLRGDTYFKIRYPGHNLHRARVQFSLLKSIEKNEARLGELTLHGAGG